MSKTDKEMLELAARAVDIETNKAGDGNQTYCYDRRDCVYKNWDPLNNDGDALRLAVDLDIDLSFDADNGTIQAAYWINSMNFAWKEELTVGDKHAATRRAIVRAAAAIGEGME